MSVQICPQNRHHFDSKYIYQSNHKLYISEGIITNLAPLSVSFFTVVPQ